MALVGSVQNVIDQIGREILLLDAQAAKSLIPILSAAHAELGNDLAKILGQAGGDQKFTAQQYRNALAQMKKSLATLEKMHPAIFAQLTQNAYKAGMLAHGHLGQEMEKFGLMFQGEIRPFNLDNTRLLAEGQKTLMTHHATSAKRYAGQVGKDIRAQLAIGVARGETFDQLTARLVRLGGPGARGNTPAEAADGLFKRHKYMAERLARTEVINAYNHHATEGILALHQEDPEILKRWDSSLDVRACVICKDLHGRVAKPDQPFPGGYMRSPAHPNCRCAIVAWHPEWTESAIKTQEGEPAKPTGPTLAEQAAKIKAEGKIKPDGSGGAGGKLPNRPKTKKVKPPAPPAPVPPAMTTMGMHDVPVWGDSTKVVPVGTPVMVGGKYPGTIAGPMTDKSTVPLLVQIGGKTFPAEPAAHEVMVKIPTAKLPDLQKQYDRDFAKWQEDEAKAKAAYEAKQARLAAAYAKAKAKAKTAEKAKEVKQAHEKAVQETKKLLASKDKNFLFKQEVTPAFVEQVAEYLKVPANTVPQALKELKKDLAKAAKAEQKAQAAQAKAAKQEAKREAKQAKLEADQARKLARNAPKPSPAAPVAYTPGAKLTPADLPAQNMLGLRGTYLPSDSDAVEGQTINAKRVVGLDGKEYTEAQFKLTADHGARVYNEIPDDGARRVWEYRSRTLKGGVLTDNGKATENGGRARQVTYTLPDGTQYKAEVGETGANRNRVRITVPGGDPAKTLEALEHFGAQHKVQATKIPTPADHKAMATARAASKVDPAGLGKKGHKDPLVQKIVDDAKAEEVYPGHMSARSQSLRDAVKGNAHALIHDSDKGPDIAAQIVGDSGLMSSHTRYDSGIFITGQSTGRDFETGGADGAFVRLTNNEAETKSAFGRFRFEIDMDEMGRLDWWAFNSDRYGRAGPADAPGRRSVEDIAKNRHNGGNEIMFQGGIPAKAIKSVSAGSAQDREELIKRLKVGGRTHVNGVLIEEFVKRH